MMTVTLSAPIADPDLADLDIDDIDPADREWWSARSRDDADDAPDFDLDPTDDDLAEMMTRGLIADGYAII